MTLPPGTVAPTIPMQTLPYGDPHHPAAPTTPMQTLPYLEPPQPVAPTMPMQTLPTVEPPPAYSPDGLDVVDTPSLDSMRLSEGEIEDVPGEESYPQYTDAGYEQNAGYQDPQYQQYPTDWYGPQIIDEHTDISAIHALMEAACRRGASDLHVIANLPITIRRLGDLVPLDLAALARPYDPAAHSALIRPPDPETTERFLLPLLGPTARQRLDEVGYVDLGFHVPNRGRVRGNISKQQDGLAGTFRLGSAEVPTLDRLGLPRELEKVVRHHQGLVVVAGPSGHGKTTTMAALVDLLNASNNDHIITIEDPVEIEHPPKRAIVSHREVGRHTLSFVSALKASLREDPDVIVIGELRDRETVEIALTAAETGHLVLSTISTPSAVKTIDRLIDMFPPDDQVQVRASISGTLRAVIAQRLLPNAAGDGMVAAIELVTGVLPLATMIRDNKLFQLPSLMQRGRAFGMIRLDDSLADHVRAKRITESVALAAAESKAGLAAALSSRAAPASPTMTRGLFGPKGS